MLKKLIASAVVIMAISGCSSPQQEIVFNENGDLQKRMVFIKSRITSHPFVQQIADEHIGKDSNKSVLIGTYQTGNEVYLDTVKKDCWNVKIELDGFKDQKGNMTDSSMVEPSASITVLPVYTKSVSLVECPDSINYLGEKAGLPETDSLKGSAKALSSDLTLTSHSLPEPLYAMF